MKRQHIWDIIVKNYRDEQLSVSATIAPNDEVHSVEAILDIFDTKESIEIEKELSEYDNSNDSPIDPIFGSW